ncbi:MAG: hypothetical protein KAG82_02715 [Alcanivoracaceae bacterium]|jgi:hypothetical protein|nr:hypothetical protein [Alcanivoracaceae bacterium]
MTLEALDNLVKTGSLKAEAPDQKEFDGMLRAARRGLEDASVVGLSEEGRFSLAYGAAHAAALAALRWHGYRSESRYLVFQCLQHTVGLEAGKWRVLDLCHRHRNLAEYEGHLDIPAQLIEELIGIVGEVVLLVEGLGAVR